MRSRKLHTEYPAYILCAARAWLLHLDGTVTLIPPECEAPRGVAFSMRSVGNHPERWFIPAPQYVGNCWRELDPWQTIAFLVDQSEVYAQQDRDNEGLVRIQAHEEEAVCGSFAD